MPELRYAVVKELIDAENGCYGVHSIGAAIVTGSARKQEAIDIGGHLGQACA